MTAHGKMAHSVTHDVSYLRLAIVNVVFVGAPDAGDLGWVLVDAGIHGSAGRIRQAAERRFGAGARPSAIVMTHGHFDHIGALEQLASEWDAPVYAHEWELPYLTGRSAYPPPDPAVGGGAMSMLSPLYPRGPIDLGERVLTLPADGAVPGMPGWRWVYTPGHAPGHVAFWREEDRLLISGDAVITTRQESALSVLTQKPQLHGPPMYYTVDWDSARESVETIASLEPDTLVPMHGRPMRGPALTEGLHRLARNFDRVARPKHGRYVQQPAVADASGVVSVPPAVPNHLPMTLLGVGAVALGVGMVMRGRRR